MGVERCVVQKPQRIASERRSAAKKAEEAGRSVGPHVEAHGEFGQAGVFEAREREGGAGKGAGGRSGEGGGGAPGNGQSIKKKRRKLVGPLGHIRGARSSE